MRHFKIHWFGGEEETISGHADFEEVFSRYYSPYERKWVMSFEEVL